jgi:4-amino-4-deoxy-L-arabinose transferase-like glycosyltransferase
VSSARNPGFTIRNREWAFVVLLLLLAWGLRLCWLEEVPPGWRDDELINIHALSSRVLNGQLPLYYLGASGHEPLYHHLHAGVHAVLGFNVLSGHVLSVAFGTLSIALTYSLVRRLFPETRAIAAVSSLTLAASFWSLMYSRTAIRHIILPPFTLATIYAFWRQMEATDSTFWGWGLVGLLLGATLYTYTASRLLPVLLVLFVSYLALFHRHRLRIHWRGLALALTLMALLSAPLGVAIARGRSERAIEGIGADARVTELARPVRALREGNVRPLLTSIVRTLGMFHATGDPEWLYNISGRSVFNVLGGALLWSGVAVCLYRWRQPRHFFLLSWFGLGLSPAFISTPPASLGHTILAQPVAYILPALALSVPRRWLRQRGTASFLYSLLIVAFVSTSTIRDLRDYFIVWPERGMVRLLYRADHREAAKYLNAHPEISDIAIASALMGPWDRIALQVDVKRQDVAPRLFNPERALIWAIGDRPTVAAPVLVLSWPDPAQPIEDLLRNPGASETGLGSAASVAPHLTLYVTSPISQALEGPESAIARTPFANGLVLTGARWLDADSLAPGREAILLTGWHVASALDLPPVPIIAQPPPPRTYAGPRLAVFAHLLDGDGHALVSDDGLWVDPLTLQSGDRFVQIHRFPIPDGAADGPYALDFGLYDPKTGERWPVLGHARHGLGSDGSNQFGEILSCRDSILSPAETSREPALTNCFSFRPAPVEHVARRQDGHVMGLDQLVTVRRRYEDS